MPAGDINVMFKSPSKVCVISISTLSTNKSSPIIPLSVIVAVEVTVVLSTISTGTFPQKVALSSLITV